MTRRSPGSWRTTRQRLNPFLPMRCAGGSAAASFGREPMRVRLAKFFVATIQGMRAMARLKSDRRALRQVARIALAVFDR